MRATLILVCASLLSAQTPVAVFNGTAPNFKSMTIGASHVYMWSGLPAPWPVEAACYDGVGIPVVEGFNPAEPHRAKPGGCITADGSFTWIFSVNPSGGVDWKLGATPIGGTSNSQQGTF